ncbi:hypothetical protein MRX96_052991 [Rhipicephalus microplus]
MLASAPCKEALTDGFHLPSKGASNWSDTARFSSWCLASRVHVVRGGPPTLLQSSSSAWNHAWQCPVFDSTTSLPVVTPIISECSSASSSPSHKFISSRHPPRDFSGHGRAAAMQSTKNPFFLLLQLLTMLASAPCKEALTDGFHLPSKGASNWSDTARFSSWCLASRVHVVRGGPPTLLQSSSSAWNHAWQCPVFDSTTSLPVVTPIISECSSASSSPSHKFISSRHPPRDFIADDAGFRPLQRSSNGRLSPTFEGRFQLERHGEVLFVVPCVTGACCSGRTANASAVFFFGLESCLAVPRV